MEIGKAGSRRVKEKSLAKVLPKSCDGGVEEGTYSAWRVDGEAAASKSNWRSVANVSIPSDLDLRMWRDTLQRHIEQQSRELTASLIKVSSCMSGGHIKRILRPSSPTAFYYFISYLSIKDYQRIMPLTQYCNDSHGHPVTM